MPMPSVRDLVSITSNFAIEEKNLLNALTLPGLLILKRGMLFTTCRPLIIYHSLLIDPCIRMFTTRLLPTAPLEDDPAVAPWSATYCASAAEAICVGMGAYLTTLSGSLLPSASVN